jgi:GMP synthase (glutamine-hydrolysing)
MSELLTQAGRIHETPPETSPVVLVVDFGAQYAQLIARRVREAHVFSKIVPHTISAEALLQARPAAIILSGGPASVYSDGAPSLDPAVLDSGIPVLGICYGFQAMAAALDGTVKRTQFEESGRTPATVDPDSVLFAGLDQIQSVWMSHHDSVVDAPTGFRATAHTPGAVVAAFENREKSLYGIQWHPEVAHTENGQRVIERFLFDGAGITPDWTTESIIDEAVGKIREQVGAHTVICGLSGGVDSAVAAALVQRAVGSQLKCVFIDHGLLREGEAEQVEIDFVKATGVELTVWDARKKFLEALSNDEMKDPEKKRLAIGRQFIRSFEDAAAEIIAKGGDPIPFLVQGTLYPDVVESGGGEGAQNIKSHHNVGGLPDDLKFSLVEPLRTLFKDEVRQVGLELGLPEEIVWRHPFPGPGLAIRIVGQVTEDNLATLRKADAIAQEEVRKAGFERAIWQFPVVLLADVRSVGVQGDGRTYGHPVVLRPVTSDDAMTADWAQLPYDLLQRISTRITNEVEGVTRVVLDITSKPPGTIEWE